MPVPDSPEYIAQFMGAIWRMGIQSHYERDEAHSGAVVAAKWRAIWLEVQSDMGCCRGDTITNYYNYQSYQLQMRILLQSLTLRYINASLNVQVAFFDVPDTYEADPGDIGDEIAERNQALCLACESWVDEICNQGTSFIQGAAIDGIPFAAGAVVVPFIPTAVVGFIAIGALYFGAAIWIQLNDEDYRSYLACGMYEALKGESTTSEAGFDQAFDNLPARPPPAEGPVEDDARDIIELWLRGVVNDRENWLGFVSILGSAMSIAATLPPGSCECYSCSSVTYDLDGSLPDAVKLDPYTGVPIPTTPPGSNGYGGIWKLAIGRTGDGIESTVTGVSDIINCRVFVAVDPNCTIVKVNYAARYEAGGANRGKWLNFLDADGIEIHRIWAGEGHNPGSNWEDRTSGVVSVTGCSWVHIVEESRTSLDDWVRVDDIDILY